MTNSNSINASHRTSANMLDIDTIFYVDAVLFCGSQKSCIFPQICMSIILFYMKWGLVSTLKLANFNSLIY